MTSDIKKHLFGVDICAKDDNGSIPVDYSGIQLEIERILNNYIIFRQYKQQCIKSGS